jgi:hypothetical protein
VSASDQLSLEWINSQLTRLKKPGLRARNLASVLPLVGALCPHSEANPHTSLECAAVAEQRIRQIVEERIGGEAGEALLILFALMAGYSTDSLTKRYDAAGKCFKSHTGRRKDGAPGMEGETFEKKYQKPLITDLAIALYIEITL